MHCNSSTEMGLSPSQLVSPEHYICYADTSVSLVCLAHRVTLKGRFPITFSLTVRLSSVYYELEVMTLRTSETVSILVDHFNTSHGVILGQGYSTSRIHSRIKIRAAVAQYDVHVCMAYILHIDRPLNILLHRRKSSCVYRGTSL